MPVTPTYPGVYVEEIPSGVHTITGVATSIAAFIDYFTMGPMNKAVEILSFADFEREFGGLSASSEAGYGIQQFFLNGGSQAWMVRVGSGGASANVILDDPAGNHVIRAIAGRRIRGTSVEDQGTWANSIFIDVDYSTSDPSNISLFNLFVSQMVVQSGRLTPVTTETYRNLTMQIGAGNNAIDVVNAGSNLVQLSHDTVAGWAAIPAVAPFPRPASTGTFGTPTSVSVPADLDQFKVQVNPSGGPAGPLKTVTIKYDPAPATAPSTYPALRPFLEKAIRASVAGDPTPDGRIAGAIVELLGDGSAGAPFHFRVLTGRNALNFSAGDKLSFQELAAGATIATGLGLLGPTVFNNVQLDQLQGGVDPATVTPAELIGSPVLKSGMFALEDADLFNILCIPHAATFSSDSDLVAVYSQAETYCADKRAFLIVDLPFATNTLQKAKDWIDQHSTLRSTNAAAYFPHPRIPNPLNGFRLQAVGASGTIAGLYARTDSNRGVWKAPAGVESTLGNVQELDYVMTDPENGVLNPVGLNGLRNFPVYGNVCWGARTLMGADQLASEWKYIPVRRFALFLEESLFRGTKWVVFEPNDEPLWAQIRLNLGAFMQSLFRQGAFQGTSPRDAYFVKCDKETTTQADINNGIVNIVVGFAPLKPAEFVILKIQQIAGQIPV